ncbi:MAG: tRNA pseudouridine(38-40) synthase TruA [Candidatus Tectomicrobia bacterium]|uniref:tRNA pseudouridine synthase A n=1 Tax=Tectimicrobiota bacterium TaxID=2528274 RepID=A0A937VZL3_UNCTE|nr:tRNA pseudouridine(38-40) synthase TruA [Candidatus Tectomicrobia bacterium]
MPTRLSATRRLKLLLEYNGTRYHGWQSQPRLLTLQGTLEACLGRLTNAPIRVHASGRTDAGVHALGQVVHFDTASTIALPALVRGANSLLPDDFVVREAIEVPADFHARFSACRKTYVYRLHNDSIPSALWAPYVWHVPQGLDVPAMRLAANVLLGHHDFSAFRAASCTAKNPWREVFALRLSRHAERLLIMITANAFLQYMVRNIVGTLVAIGRTKIPAAAMATILQSGQRHYAGPTAPAQGLCLLRVQYAPHATALEMSSVPDRRTPQAFDV